MPPRTPQAPIIITGGSGFLGSAIVRALGPRPGPTFIPRSRDCDLRTPDGAQRMLLQAREAFGGQPPALIIHAAARSGGLALNRAQPAHMALDNLSMAMHLLGALREADLLRPEGPAIVYVSNMTAYPADAPQPYREADLWLGLPDPVLAAYGLAKRVPIALLDACRGQHGVRACTVIPTNLYGPGDHLDDARVAHVAGALLGRFLNAARNNTPEVSNWGTGSPTRQFLYVDDAAEGILRAAEALLDGRLAPGTVLNLAPREEVSIRDLASRIARLVGYGGRVTWDASKGDGVPRRALDPGLAESLLGWRATTGLDDGLARTIAWARATHPRGAEA